MAERTVVEPDLEFKRRILGLGAGDLTLCYQCGTCSVVCPISTPEQPFPRKEMVWVQWGLKDRLMADPAMWLCHQCGTCTTYCPRDARPADVMAALRDYSITHYAPPRFLGRAANDLKLLPLLLAIPTLIFLGLLGWLGHLTALPAGRVVFSRFVPIIYVEVIFSVAVGLAALAALTGGIRYWRTMAALGSHGNGAGPGRSLAPVLREIFAHARFGECETGRVGTRQTHKGHLHRSHLAIFYGFLGLLVTTASIGIGIYAFGYLTPWPLWHPVKILGYGSGAALLVACAVFGYRRLADGEKAGKSTYSDWLFLGVLFLTTLTGFLSSWLRLAGTPAPAYWTYFVHLVLIFFLLVYLPYSKFAHLVYRTTAMLYASRSRGATDRASG